jgi:hypothetical protein
MPRSQRLIWFRQECTFWLNRFQRDSTFGKKKRNVPCQRTPVVTVVCFKGWKTR